MDASHIVRLAVETLSFVSVGCLGSFGLGQIGALLWANPQS